MRSSGVVRRSVGRMGAYPSQPYLGIECPRQPASDNCCNQAFALSEIMVALSRSNHTAGVVELRVSSLRTPRHASTGPLPGLGVLFVLRGRAIELSVN